MNDLIVGNSANLPAHARASASSNLAGDMGGEGHPRLTFKSGRFRIRMGGDERVLGATELPVVILEANPHVSRVYFDKAFDGEGGSRPACASEDGVVPLDTVGTPQSSACATCPKNEKGSAVTDTGGKTKACQYFKRVVVMLVDEPNLGPLVADMKAMSMFGNSKPDVGEFSLRDYAKKLEQNKVAPHAVITTLSFDTDESVPKVLFKATDYTSVEFHEAYVETLLETGELKEWASTSDTNTGDDEAEQKPDGFRDKLLNSSDPKEGAAEAVEKHGTDTVEPEPKPEPEPDPEELSPQQKAAITRRKNLAKKKLEEEVAAEEAKRRAAEKSAKEADLVEAAPVEKEDNAEDGFPEELENALAEFEFD